MDYLSVILIGRRETVRLSQCVDEPALPFPVAQPRDKCFSVLSHCVPCNRKKSVIIVPLPLPLTSCLALIQSFNLSESQCPHLITEIIPRPCNNVHKVSSTLQCLHTLVPPPSPTPFPLSVVICVVVVLFPQKGPPVETQHHPLWVVSLPLALL